MRRHRRGAGAGAAGQGDADAAFPHPHADMAAVQHLGEFDIDAVGKQGMGLDQGPDLGHRRLFGIAHEQDAMGIAHRTAALAVMARLPAAKWNWMVSIVLGQGNLVPVQLGRAHIHRHQALAGIAADQRCRPCSSSLTRARPALVHQQPGDAARGVAAGFHFAAIGIEEAQAWRRPWRCPAAISTTVSQPMPKWRSAMRARLGSASWRWRARARRTPRNHCPGPAFCGTGSWRPPYMGSRAAFAIARTRQNSPSLHVPCRSRHARASCLILACCVVSPLPEPKP